MATDILTPATPEELEAQFPHTLRPFGVWYNTGETFTDDPIKAGCKWVVNSGDSMPLDEFGARLKAQAI